MKKMFLLLALFSVFLPLVEAFDEDISDEDKYAIYAERKEIYTLKNMYDYLSGGKKDNEEIVYEEVISSDSYWWPIGSVETTSVNGKVYAIGEPDASNINSNFSFRYFNGEWQIHGGIDIGTSSGIETNVIASKSGIVVYPTKSSKTDYINFDPDYNKKYCVNSNISYGNYVMIQHDDGNYTLYGHLSPNSITVKAGDVVEQGQVIAKMGSSGCSTGAHLHFEMRIGSQSYSNIANPTEYVSIDNPRPKNIVNTPSSSISFDELVDYVFTWEGIACESLQTDTEYTACYSDKDKVITVGHGVTWEGTSDVFKKYGITEMHHGSKVSKEIADKVGIEALKISLEKLKKDLANSGIDNLKEYQLMALISQIYNGGYTVIKGGDYDYGFISAYLRHNGVYSFDDVYKSKSSIWYDSMCHPYGPGTEFELGLKRRRVSEWKLFTLGEIDFYPLSTFNPDDYSWGD